jgi:signal transduction histidine kinase
LLDKLLRSRGYRVIQCHNGAEALDAARKEPPDIIVSDILMPVMDGFTLCKNWSRDERLRTIPFIFYTATYTDSRDEQLAMSLGAARFIVKPADSEVFLNIIQAVLDEFKRGAAAVPNTKSADEEVILARYNETLVRKLEQKVQELKDANLALEAEISQRKQMEDRLVELYEEEKKQREELNKEAKARGLFIDVLAHELRTPLTPILASTGMLNDMIKTSPDVIQKKLCSNISSSVQKLAARLEELLDLAAYSRGTFKLNPIPVDMNQYIQEVTTRFQPVLAQKSQQISINHPEVSTVVEIDPSRLEQVLTNLLSNASKFGPQNSLIELKMEITEEGLKIEVTDHGIGISEEDQARLFQPYHRVEQDRQKFPGIGLGLAVCKQIVEAHHGKIWVTSQPEKGSTFIILLPMKVSSRQ